MKDLKYLYEFEKLLESANNPLVQQACAEGKHALAYTCYHMPEVLLNTGDCFSVRLRAPLTGSLDISSYYMSNFICDYCKSLLERGIEGGYNFLSALLATETCSEMNRALEHFELLHLVDNEQFFVTFLDMPFKVTDNTVRHYVDQLRRKVLEPLHEVYGVDVSDDALRKAVAEHNEVCRILTEIGQLRKEENPRITGYEYHILNLVSYCCPKYLIVDKLRETLEELRHREPDARPNFRGKIAVVGSESLNEGTHICAAHIDSPRLDLKPNPLYEDAGMAYFKTHYYGGIKKYQWTAIPLELRGVVCVCENGEVKRVQVRVGDKPTDPKFVITDLLPHLATEQMTRKATEVIKGEGLNILIGSVPSETVDEKCSEKIKLAIMEHLNREYGMTEADFLSAELCCVPAFGACDIGFDRSFVGAYGHDDRVCSYPAATSLFDLTETPAHTGVCLLVDKEEIGSDGVTGMQSRAFDTFMADLCRAQDVLLDECFENSVCLSADVCNAFDPNYPEVSEKRNDARANCGFALVKYTGARGKSGTSDATAELMARIRCIFDKAGVIWQTGQLGKVDQGGGGTVAMYLANRNIDTVDAGVPVLSMHAPFECIAKLDLYMAYKGFGAFYRD